MSDHKLTSSLPVDQVRKFISLHCIAHLFWFSRKCKSFFTPLPFRKRDHNSVLIIRAENWVFVLITSMCVGSQLRIPYYEEYSSHTAIRNGNSFSFLVAVLPPHRMVFLTWPINLSKTFEFQNKTALKTRQKMHRDLIIGKGCKSCQKLRAYLMEGNLIRGEKRKPRNRNLASA